MNTIPITSILVREDRQRRTFDEAALADLRDSILEHGLFHALLLAPDGRTLIAGESRLRAIKMLPEPWVVKYDGIELPPCHVPYTVAQTDDPVAIFEMELHENIKRRDLPWQEQAAAVAKLHELRISQHGEYSPKDNPTGWSLRKTAAEMNPDMQKSGGQHVIEVQEDLKLAQALDDPEIARIKDKKRALKALELKQKLQANASVAANIPRVTHEDYKYKIADAIDVLTALPDGSIDILLSDPPYGRNFHKSELWSGQKRAFDDSPEAYKKLMVSLARLLAKKLAPQSHVYLFCDIYHFNWLREVFAFNIPKFESWRHPIIWDKGHMGSFVNIEYGPRHVYDYIFYGYRGERKVANVDKDIISGILPLEDKRHPDEKPSDVFRNLINRSANAGDLIVDPFCGAGTIFLAGAGLQCRIFACDDDPAHEVFIQQSISQAATYTGARKL